MNVFIWVQVLCRHILIHIIWYDDGQSLWPPGLSRGSAASRLLGLRVRIPPEHGMSCVLPGRGLRLGLVTSCWVSCVSECDRKAFILRRTWSVRCRLVMAKIQGGIAHWRSKYVHELSERRKSVVFSIQDLFPLCTLQFVFFFCSCNKQYRYHSALQHTAWS